PRIADVASEFSVRRWRLSHLDTKAAPAARRIFEHRCKTTFAAKSAGSGHRRMVAIHALVGGLVHSYSCAMLDWEALREALQTALLEAVSAEAGGPWCVGALDQVYAETDGIITAPSLFLNDNGEHIDSPADWGHGIHDWAPERWIEALTAEACSGTVSHWEDIFARYRDVLVRICVAAGAHLGMPVFCVDHDCYEETLARCLTPSQLRSLFPK